jgi:hypothetical protein
MDQNGHLASPTPAGVDPLDPRVVAATPVPEYMTPDPYANVATEAIRVVQPAVQPVAYAPVPPVYTLEEPFIDDPHPVWPYFVAVIALLAGGLVGFLIGAAGDNNETPPPAAAPAGDTTETLDLLLTRTREDGEYLTPSEYPQLDEITEIDNAAATRDLQGQVELLTAAQEQAAGLTDQVTNLETALTEMTAERDALAVQAGDSNQQSDLDAANDRIATLESELDTARTDLEAANKKVTQTEAALQTAISERDAANATIDELNIIPNPSYINGPITKTRSDAAANGWTLIEQPTASATAAPGTVLDQAPPAESNMINGSVLYVTVAERP